MNDPDLPSGILLFIVLGNLGGLALLVTRNQRRNMRYQEALFFTAFAIRFAMSIVLYQFGLIGVLGDEDGSGWFRGVLIKDEWDQLGVGILDLPERLTQAFVGVNKGYGYLLATLFHLTGLSTRLPAAALSASLGALTCVLVYRIAACLFIDRVARRAGWWVCLFPSLILWSAQTMKEPVVIFLEALAIYGSLSLRRYGMSLRNVALCILSAAALFTLRFYVCYICMLMFLTFAFTLFNGKEQGGLRKLLAASSLAAPVVIFMLSGAANRMQEDVENFGVKEIEGFKRNVSTGQGSNSGVVTTFDIKSPSGFVMAELVGGVHLLLAPFPWQLGGASLRMALTLPELAVWWWLFLWGVIPGLRNLIRTRLWDVLPLLVFIIGLGLLYSVMFGNVGIVFRQRAQLLPWLLIFAEHGLERRRLRRASPPARVSWDGPGFTPLPGDRPPLFRT